MTDQPELISLADLIDQIKTDLLDKRPTGTPAFFIDAVEVTAQVVVSRKRSEGGDAGVGLNLSVLGFKAEASIDTRSDIGSQMTQQVTIKLSPLVEKADYKQGLVAEALDTVEAQAAQAVARGGLEQTVNPA
jgi:hypothetical protein